MSELFMECEEEELEPWQRSIPETNLVDDDDEDRKPIRVGEIRISNAIHTRPSPAPVVNGVDQWQTPPAAAARSAAPFSPSLEAEVAPATLPQAAAAAQRSSSGPVTPQLVVTATPQYVTKSLLVPVASRPGPLPPTAAATARPLSHTLSAPIPHLIIINNPVNTMASNNPDNRSGEKRPLSREVMMMELALKKGKKCDPPRISVQPDGTWWEETESASNSGESGQEEELAEYQIPEDIVEEEAQNRPKKKKKGVNYRKQNADNRQLGKEYTGKKKVGGKTVKVTQCPRSIGDRCHHGCNEGQIRNKGGQQCEHISEEQRQKIFTDFWEMSWVQRKVYVSSQVEARPTKRQTTGNRSRKNRTYNYTLQIDDRQVPVCQTMFLATLNIGAWSVHEWAKSGHGNTPAATENAMTEPQSPGWFCTRIS